MDDETTEAIRIRLQFEADQSEKKAKRMERQLAALESRFDPLARATRRYEQGVKVLEKSLERGTVDAARYEKAMEGLNAEFERAKVQAGAASSAVSNMAVSSGGLAGAMSRNQVVLQQVGYQVGDFAVQVQSGQNAMVAFAQQGTQRLGVFGAYGAVAGAALAIGAPLAASFFRGGEEAETYADVVDQLTESLEVYKNAAELAGLSTEELTERFGSSAKAIQGSLGLLADLAMQAALNDLLLAAEAFSEEFGDAFADLDATGRGSSRVLRDAFAGLSEQFGITREQALALRNAVDEIGNANGPREVSLAARALNDLLLEIYGSAEDIPKEFQRIAEAAAKADVQASELRATIEDSVVSVLDIVVAVGQIDFSGAIAGAEGLLGVLQEAWKNAAAMANTRVKALLSLEYADLGAGAAAYGGAQTSMREGLAAIKYSPDGRLPALSTEGRGRKSRSGRKGGRGEVSAIQREIEAMQRSAKAAEIKSRALAEVAVAGQDFSIATEKAEAKARLLAAANKDGTKVSGELAEQIDQLAEKYATSSQAAAKVKDVVRMMAEVEQAAFDAMSAADRFGVELAELNELHAMGHLNAEQHAAAIEALGAKYERIQVDRLQGDFEDLIGTLVDARRAGEDVGEALRRWILDAILKAQLQALSKQLAGLFSGLGGGKGSGLFGFLFGASFDGGGYTGAGARVGGIDGKGGFPAVLHPNETVIDHTKGGSVMARETSQMVPFVAIGDGVQVQWLRRSQIASAQMLGEYANQQRHGFGTVLNQFDQRGEI